MGRGRRLPAAMPGVMPGRRRRPRWIRAPVDPESDQCGVMSVHERLRARRRRRRRPAGTARRRGSRPSAGRGGCSPAQLVGRQRRAVTDLGPGVGQPGEQVADLGGERRARAPLRAPCSHQTSRVEPARPARTASPAPGWRRSRPTAAAPGSRRRRRVKRAARGRHLHDRAGAKARVDEAADHAVGFTFHADPVVGRPRRPGQRIAAGVGGCPRRGRGAARRTGPAAPPVTARRPWQPAGARPPSSLSRIDLDHPHRPEARPRGGWFGGRLVQPDVPGRRRRLSQQRPRRIPAIRGSAPRSAAPARRRAGRDPAGTAGRRPRRRSSAPGPIAP